MGAAGGFDGCARLRYVVDDEAEVMRTDVACPALAGVFLFLVAKKRQVHDAVGEVDAAGAVPIRCTDAAQTEGAHVELCRLFRVGHGDREMP